MGSCLTQCAGQRSNRIKYTILEQIISPYSFEDFKKKWTKESITITKDQIYSTCKQMIDFQHFCRVFPKLHDYSGLAKKKIFHLLSSNKNEVSRQQLLNGLIVFKEANLKTIKKIIFYIYADKQKEILENKKIPLNNFQLFLEDNLYIQKQGSNYHKQFKQIKKQESNSNSKSKSKQKQKQKQNWLSYDKFLTILQNYDLKKFVSLMQWSFLGMEIQLSAKIKKKVPIVLKRGQSAYVIQYKWYLHWKRYMQIRHKCQLELQHDATERLSKICTIKQTISKQIVNQTNHPEKIRNASLQGFYPNQLKRNLIELNDYILIPQWLWTPLTAIYKYDIAFKRTYPQIYSLSVILVSIDEYGYFIPRKINNDLNITRNSGQIHTFVKLYKIQEKDSQLTSFFSKNKKMQCYIKHPGKIQWQYVSNINQPIQNYVSHHRTYVCFVPQALKDQFCKNYNVSTNFSNQKIIFKNIENYASALTILHGGMKKRAYVVGILDSQFVELEFQDSDGSFLCKSFQISELQKNNHQQLKQSQYLNKLAGMDNLGNTCYVNSSIQCLIRTPLFANYLQKYDKPQSAINIISDSFNKSKQSTNLIQTFKIKKLIDLHFPFYKGFRQQDAHQFLTDLLNKVSQQICKVSKLSNDKSNSSQIRIKGKQNRQSSKILEKTKYFSGMHQITYKCKKCQCVTVCDENFLTLPVTLPLYNVQQFYFTFVPKFSKLINWKMIRYGLTLKKNITLKQASREISNKVKLSLSKLFIIPIFNCEWMKQYNDDYLNKQLSFIKNWGMNIYCYQIIDQQNPNILLSKALQNQSHKLEMRHRYYNKKNSSFQSFNIPYLIEITQNTTWNEIKGQIYSMLQSSIDYKYLNMKSSTKNVKGSQIALKRLQSHNDQFERDNNFSSIRHFKNSEDLTNNYKFVSSIKEIQPSKFQMSRQQAIEQLKNTNQTSKSKQMLIINNERQLKKQSLYPQKAIKPYKIRLISKMYYNDNECLLCRKQFTLDDTPTQKDKYCQGCIPNNIICEDRQLRLKLNNCVIVIDWQDYYAFKLSPQKFDQSYQQTKNNTEKRVDKLQKILIAQDTQQLNDFKCSQCKSTYVLRIEKIKVYPNILIVHLKRFSYEDNCLIKLMNNVDYPQHLTIQNQKYLLYGVVNHIGSGLSGHYYSYVNNNGLWYKCDDERVKQAPNKQFVDKNAYLLFYKKEGFIPNLLHISF